MLRQNGEGEADKTNETSTAYSDVTIHDSRRNKECNPTTIRRGPPAEKKRYTHSMAANVFVWTIIHKQRNTTKEERAVQSTQPSNYPEQVKNVIAQLCLSINRIKKENLNRTKFTNCSDYSILK